MSLPSWHRTSRNGASYHESGPRPDVATCGADIRRPAFTLWADELVMRPWRLCQACLELATKYDGRIA